VLAPAGVEHDAASRTGVRVVPGAMRYPDAKRTSIMRTTRRRGPAMRARRMRVTGRVQGVAFRASACDEARRLGLAGWVRNLADGGVELVAQGHADALDALERWCHSGPPAARVASVVVEDVPLDPARSGFDVVR
jgi:acylphosphatase